MDEHAEQLRRRAPEANLDGRLYVMHAAERQVVDVYKRQSAGGWRFGFAVR